MRVVIICKQTGLASSMLHALDSPRLYLYPEDFYNTSKPTYAAREETALEAAVNREWNAAQRLLSVLATAESVETHVPELHGAIFCGHLVADLDSVAGAIGAAALYGGVPARASEVNSETEFALATWGIDLSRIRPVEQLLEEQGDSARVCLVDFQQTTQLHPAIQPSKIVGVIDHHALQSSTIVTQRPIFVDIRPWGSMSTIIAHSFVVLQREEPLPCGHAPVHVAFAVVETTDAAGMLARVPELELSSKGKPVDAFFLAVVDIVELETHPLSSETLKLAGKESARSLYRLAAGQADFVPPLTDAVAQGWSPKLLQPNRSEFDLAALAEQSEVSVQFTPAGETFVRSHSADKRKLDDFIGGETNQGH
ncbi:hypothetical protein EMIHUDRAFT_243977 [Emiliania huxleyi CCMP1516]|uniref:DDH domain-containing protein n=2 Tax=Emiliania huxleyi TaxID=2903 RepID=A0A0D3J244_EMIH1|nr:hypothetical protein EMIHUDRAFT_243977 [Emiliania huxleyi CCMP1516]EOD17579.1 hypothetical protein EMIHUDRAFT_243977 [Emiliania huxleyi CCMP1516]|eukprot:XP_005770008.1 hypothetical protein EMIHUDRAFT_243977 [Emiliania huxleyi CCMP1516]